MRLIEWKLYQYLGQAWPSALFIILGTYRCERVKGNPASAESRKDVRFSDGTRRSQLRGWRSSDRRSLDRSCGICLAGKPDADTREELHPRRYVGFLEKGETRPPRLISRSLADVVRVTRWYPKRCRLFRVIAGVPGGQRLLRGYAIRARIASDRTKLDHASGGSSSFLKHFCPSFNLATSIYLFY